MAKFTKTLSGDSRYSIELEVKETSTNISENTSVVSYTLKATKSSGSGYYTSSKTNVVKVSLDGSEIVNKKIAYDFTGSTPKTITLASGTKTITHNADGSKTIACSGYFKDAENSLGSATASGNLTLTALHTPPDVSISSITEGVTYLTSTLGLDNDDFVSNVSKKTIVLTATTYDSATITSFKVENGNYSVTTTNITNNSGSVLLDFQNNPLTVSGPAEGMIGNNRVLLKVTATDNKGGSKTTTIGYSVSLVDALNYSKPTITPTSVTSKRDGQLTGKVKLNASGTFTTQIGHYNNLTTLSPTLVLQVYEHGSSTLKFSRNITTSDTGFTTSGSTWTLTDLQIGAERGTSQTPPNNWFNPELMYDLVLTIKDAVTTNAPLTPLQATSNVLIGEATWTEYKDRVDFKKLTIDKKQILAPYVLYDNSSGSKETITGLNDSISNYTYLEIFYGWEGLLFGSASTRYDIALGGTINLGTSVLNNNAIYWGSSEWTPNGTTLTLTKGEYWRLQTTGSGTRSTVNNIAIYKILGYK